MNKKLIKLLICIILLPQLCSAVEIHQVLYDPSVESGGEAIELHNPDPIDKDISGWIIATETSSSDAVIPTNTSLKAGDYYLITDKGWDEKKDNPKWRSADLETPITLNNKDSGIALKDSNNTIIDKVGWGNKDNIKNNLYENTPFKNIKPGKVLLRINDTNNNQNDFKEADADFFGQNTIKAEVNVSNSTNETLKILEGNKIKPLKGESRTITIQTSNPTNITFLNQTYEVDNEIELELDYFLEPGNYTITSDNAKVEFEYLELKAYEIISSKILFNAMPGESSTAQNKITLKNAGNVKVNLNINADDFQSNNNKINSENLKFSTDNNDFNDLSDIELKPGTTEDIFFSIYIPDNTPTGQYKSTIEITEN